MYKKHLNVLMAISIFVLGSLCALSAFSQAFPEGASMATDEPVLEGENSIDNIKIIRDQAGVVKVTFDYYFTGKPHFASLYALAKAPETARARVMPNSLKAKRGKNSVELEIISPRLADSSVTVTHSIKVGMNLGLETAPIVEKEIPYVVEWDTTQEVQWRQKIATASIDQLYEESVSLIDNGYVKEANRILEQIILKDAKFAPAYVELGRTAMKGSWNPQGLSQAENYILTALKINPEYANAHVLLGYVYTHQNRFVEAEKSFRLAEKIGTKNLWLWANWGELLVLQGNPQDAVKKYMAAVDGVRPYNTYDRARLDAFGNLFRLLNDSSDREKKDALYKKRSEEFSDACFIQEHAYFKLSAFNDYKSAIELAKLSIDRGCTKERAKSTLGLAHYFAWLQAPEDFGLLAKAKVFYPQSAGLYYDLARSDSGVKIIKKLIEEGTSVDIADSQHRTALSLALFNRDSASVKTLISLGADVHHTLGAEEFPIAFIPMMYDDQQSIALLKQAGVNYQTLRFRGLTASEFVRQNYPVQNGNRNL